jgi:hypothetical protein
VLKKSIFKSNSFIVLAMPPNDGQQWPKHVKTKLLIAAVTLLALAGFNYLFT